MAEQWVVERGGHFYSAASGRRLFSASTAVAGVAPGTALSTTPPCALWNPKDSGLNLSVIRLSLGYVSGTLGAGSIVLARVVDQPTAPTGGTERDPVSAMIGASQRGGAGRYYEGSTLAATPTILRAFCHLGAALATTATFPALASEPIDGEFVVTPGSVFVMQGVAAGGTTPLVLFGVSWEEVPISA